MEDQILKELTLIKICLAKLVGNPEVSTGAQFSNELLDKAAKDFQTLTIQRGEWLKVQNPIAQIN